MAIYYVYSGATGAGNGSSWTNAFTTIGAACSPALGGDTIYVAHDHSETTSSNISWSAPTQQTNPVSILCVNRLGSVPPVAADLRTTAVVTTTGSFSSVGSLYVYGLTINVGATSSAIASMGLAFSNWSVQRWFNCLFQISTTSSTAWIEFASSSNQSSLELIDCQLKFQNSNQWTEATGSVLVRSTTGASLFATGSAIPNYLLFDTGNEAVGTSIVLSNLDLSSITNLIDVYHSRLQVVNCKLNASVSVWDAPPAGTSEGIQLLNSDSGTKNYRNEWYQSQGTLTTQTTIARSGGASDGTNNFAWKYVSSSTTNRAQPGQSFDGIIWNDTTGASKTLTIHTITDNVTLTNADIWVEVDYLSSAASPIGSQATSKPANILTAGSNLASDSSTTWTTTGLTTPVKQSIGVSFTPMMKGPVKWKLRFAKPSTTIYVCPKAEIS